MLKKQTNSNQIINYHQSNQTVREKKALDQLNCG